MFSFNRGEFLENCLESVKKCATNYKVFLIDDNSDDAYTKRVIERHFSTFEQLDPCQDSSEFKTGGLYANMRFALSYTKDKNIRYALFLQDDMQLVRTIRPEDIYLADQYFNATPNSAELHTCFMKRFFYAKDSLHTRLNRNSTAYIRGDSFEGFSGFSAVGLFHVERFFKLFGDLRQGEYINNAFARENSIKMGFSAYPFMMWLPYPISHRGKERNIPLQLIERLGGCGFYPYSIFEKNKTEEFLTRDITQFPLAENWLSPKNDAPKTKSWSFAGGISNLRSRDGLRGYLASFLDWSRKTFDI